MPYALCHKMTYAKSLGKINGRRDENKVFKYYMWCKKINGEKNLKSGRWEAKLSLLERVNMMVGGWGGWWIKNLLRMNNERIVKQVYKIKLGGARRVDQPRSRWLDKVKDFLLWRGQRISESVNAAGDRNK